jgi:hypothetical protein
MAKDPRGQSDELIEILRTSLIVQLRLAGVGNREIRAIVSSGINRVVSITKHIRIRNSKGEA